MEQWTLQVEWCNLLIDLMGVDKSLSNDDNQQQSDPENESFAEGVTKVSDPTLLVELVKADALIESKGFEEALEVALKVVLSVKIFYIVLFAPDSIPFSIGCQTLEDFKNE